MKPDLLLILTRYPRPGAVKTRLIPALGPAGAAALHRATAEWTLRTARMLGVADGITLGVGYTGAGRWAMRAWLGAGPRYRRQCGGNLGARMGQAFREAFRAGHRRVVLVGTDCPELTVTHLREAFAALDQHDVVLGPARDGGYYLIGMSRWCPAVFDGVAWGTVAVLRQTRAAIDAAGYAAVLLEPLGDLDTPEDLPVWERLGGRIRDLAVIVPTLNEAAHIRETLRRVLNAAPREVLVVDGGSSDGTVAAAQACGVRVLTAPRGRALQMNAGAAAAGADALLFLHADTWLPTDYPEHVRNLLADHRTILGTFGFRLRTPFAGRRVIEAATAFRAGVLQRPYGDQAFFMRRRDFLQAGGFRNLPIMEDYECIRRMRRIGRIRVAPATVEISSRRWERLGAGRTTLINQAVVAGYRLGFPAERLAAWYRDAGRT